MSLLARDRLHRHSFELVCNREVLPILFLFLSFVVFSKHTYTKSNSQQMHYYLLLLVVHVDKWLAREK